MRRIGFLEIEMVEFSDHFSATAEAYARYRPDYPLELIAALRAASPDTRRAWDCATGNGQVAAALVKAFGQVVATDASAAQLNHAVRHPRIFYVRSLAANSGLASASVDLVTVGQALHWFDFGGFYDEVRRVARPQGVVAAWCYGRLRISPSIDRLLDVFYHETLAGCWPPQRRYIEQAYRTISFPFDPVSLPSFHVEREWSPEELCGYLRTWSAVQRCRSKTGRDPVRELEGELDRQWGPGRRRRVVWPLHVLAGRVDSR
ncbi:MAG: class I SAM-dependent methyltransferase [Desulfuromonadales bacterium]